VILMDSYGWVNMRDANATQGHAFNNAHYYWPGVSDPSVLHGLLNDDWRNIDYLAFSPSLQADIATQDLPLVPQAMQNADQVQTFTSDQWSVTILRVREIARDASLRRPDARAHLDELYAALHPGRTSRRSVIRPDDVGR
jgi:hypothetical protein